MPVHERTQTTGLHPRHPADAEHESDQNPTRDQKLGKADVDAERSDLPGRRAVLQPSVEALDRSNLPRHVNEPLDGEAGCRQNGERKQHPDERARPDPHHKQRRKRDSDPRDGVGHQYVELASVSRQFGGPPNDVATTKVSG